jgi:hypothetical protein
VHSHLPSTTGFQQVTVVFNVTFSDALKPVPFMVTSSAPGVVELGVTVRTGAANASDAEHTKATSIMSAIAICFILIAVPLPLPFFIPFISHTFLYISLAQVSFLKKSVIAPPALLR